MFLKQLQIKGFKSFADSTTLVMEPGVTVVVGPNGSGKSNVVDAIGWVLGAQRPSAVRSQKMDDVIFAGSQKRAALGRAEVTLTIDNSAGLLPIEFTEITINRVLFRSGDSEYSINGVPCRLLDVTELLSDAGVGRQQHVIISQGQIDAVLNSKPEDRRAIVEEAAGVLKYRKRKERSERRLLSTEANLTRLSDLLREVRRQLKPLEKQADAARRHGEVVEQLQVAKLFVTGRALRRQTDQLRQSIERQRTLDADSVKLKAQLADLDAQVLAAESEMTALGATDHSELLTRFETLHQRAKGASALLAERRRNIERERSIAIDESVIQGLEAEHAQLSNELSSVENEATTLLAADEEYRGAAAELDGLRKEFSDRWGDGVDSPDTELSEVRTELAALRTAVERTESDVRRVADRKVAIAAKLELQSTNRQTATEELEALRATLDGLSETAATSQTLVDETESALAVADAAARSCGEERSRWVARADALEQALDAARQRAGAKKVENVDGVLGTLLDLVAVDQGWEAAFEAAAGDALSAVVLESPQSAEAVLAQLVSGGGAGAVLALGALSGSADAPLEDAATGSRVRDHVRSANDDVNRLLDALVGAAVAIDGTWRDAIDIAIANPNAVTVTLSGDRFGPAGWRVGGSATSATGAAYEEARAAAATAIAADEDASTALLAARATANQAKEAARTARKALEDADRNEQRLADHIERLTATIAELTSELDGIDLRMAEVEGRGERERTRRDDLAERLIALEEAESARDERAAAMRADQRRVEERAAAVSALRNDVEVRAAALEERRKFLTNRRAAVGERLERNRAEADAAAERRIELNARAQATERLARFVETRSAIIGRDLAAVREERRRQSEAARTAITRLEDLRSRRAASERSLEVLREEQHRCEVADTETRMRLESLTELCRNELNVEPDVAMQAEPPLLPEGVTATERVRELERELRIMGAINPLALQEFAELSERHEFLTKQLDDIRQSRRELNKVIRAIDDEIVSVFASAYADVAENFKFLFETLFPGGQGKVQLTDPSDLLNTGIEVEARPSGKNVKKLSLLSGGERSLVALAFLFAVFRSRPSPFYVMDEVEAALDDVNLHRFLGLIAEFRDVAQLIIVSHQKRTMEAADVLYGVTMEPGGSSKVISQKVSDSRR